MENRRDELVGKTVQQAKELAEKAKELTRAEARLAAEEARDALAPARPSIQLGLAAAGLGAVGATLLLLPLLRRVASHPILSTIAGSASIAMAVSLARQAYAEFPPDLRERVRSLLRKDLSTAVEAATEPRH